MCLFRIKVPRTAGTTVPTIMNVWGQCSVGFDVISENSIHEDYHCHMLPSRISSGAFILNLFLII